MSVSVRSIDPPELADWAATLAAAFNRDPQSELRLRAPVTELDRALAAVDGADIVGTAHAATRTLSVPGAVVPAAQVTSVSVLPTHRRRGLLRRLMTEQLDDIRRRGEPIAVLTASEASIYGRFGYGIAAQATRLQIDRRDANLTTEVEPQGRLRLVAAEDALKILPDVYERLRSRRSGLLNRDEVRWERTLLDDPATCASGVPTRRYAVYEEQGDARGYVHYRVESALTDDAPAGTVHVEELAAVDVPSYVALWRYVFGIDLITTIVADGRPVDEPLFWMLADPRRLRRCAADSMWLRLVDVPAALETRRYSAAGRLRLEVSDAFAPWNAGRYELEVASDGAARCRPVTAAPDLTLDATTLASAYLGGTPLLTLRHAGRVQGTERAAQLADTMFGWSPQPWSP